MQDKIKPCQEDIKSYLRQLREKASSDNAEESQDAIVSAFEFAVDYIEVLKSEMQKKDKTIEALVGALEYYADEEHYEETQGLNGIRPPGVLKERGGKARAALASAEGI